MKPFLDHRLVCDAIQLIYIKDIRRDSRGFRYAPWFLEEINRKEFVAWALVLAMFKRARRFRR